MPFMIMTIEDVTEHISIVGKGVFIGKAEKGPRGWAANWTLLK